MKENTDGYVYVVPHLGLLFAPSFVSLCIGSLKSGGLQQMTVISFVDNTEGEFSLCCVFEFCVVSCITFLLS